jgi:integrase
MAIHQIGRTWYVDYYEGTGTNRKRVRKKVGPKKTEAIAYLGKVQAAKRENRLFDMKKEYNHTFDELLERYKEVFKEQTYYRDKKYHFPPFEKAFSGKLLAHITSFDLEKFRNERKVTPVKSGVDKVKRGYRTRETSPKPPRERAVATVNREMSTLRHMFNKAVEWGMMESSPFEKAKDLFCKENNQRMRYLMEEESTSLLNKCVGYLNHIVTVALNTGMRRSEVLSLKWSQIRNGFIYLTKTKTDEARQIPLNDTLKELFQSLPRHISSEYVYCDKNGSPYKDVRRSFNTAVKKVGIQDFRFHDLRHTFASRLVMKGVNLKTVQELLGHKDIKMTMRYAHLAEDYKVQAVKALDGGKCRNNEPRFLSYSP